MRNRRRILRLVCVSLFLSVLLGLVCAFFLRDKGPAPYRIEVLARLPGTQSCDPYAINNRGHIVGACGRTGKSELHVLWESPKKVRVIEEDRDGFSFGVLDINDSGEMVGTRWRRGVKFSEQAAVWSATGELRVLGQWEGRATQGIGINNKGEVIGRVWGRGGRGPHTAFIGSAREGVIRGEIQGIVPDTSNYRKVKWSSTEISFVWTFPPKKGLGVLACNKVGMGVGSWRPDPSYLQWQWKMYEWIRENLRFKPPKPSRPRFGVLLDLKEPDPIPLADLIPSSSGWSELRTARDIDDRGRIIGKGVYKGEERAFLMIPVNLR